VNGTENRPLMKCVRAVIT